MIYLEGWCKHPEGGSAYLQWLNPGCPAEGICLHLGAWLKVASRLNAYLQRQCLP